MTPAQLHHTLAEWERVMVEADAQMDALAALIGTSPESPMQAAIYELMGKYTTATADLIGYPDEVLIDWWTAHSFGERPMSISLHGQPLEKIENTAALADFIARDIKANP